MTYDSNRGEFGPAGRPTANRAVTSSQSHAATKDKSGSLSGGARRMAHEGGTNKSYFQSEIGGPFGSTR